MIESRGKRNLGIVLPIVSMALQKVAIGHNAKFHVWKGQMHWWHMKMSTSARKSKKN